MLSADPELLPAEVEWIPALLPESIRRIRAFGLLQRHPAEIRAYATHARFLRALPAPAPWLRAWASFSVIHLSPRRDWRTQDERTAVERLAHELCHVCVFQAFRDEAHARASQMPFWWLEGVPSVVARQEAQRMPLGELARRLGRDAPHDDRAWQAWPHEAAYGAAHHLVRALVERSGADIVRRILVRAAHDPSPAGCIERALVHESGTDEGQLWDLMWQPLYPRTRQGKSPRPSKEMPSAWQSAL